jgi:hypothetical protein
MFLGLQNLPSGSTRAAFLRSTSVLSAKVVSVMIHIKLKNEVYTA